MVATISNPLDLDLDLGDPRFFFLVVVVAGEPPSHSRHFDHHFPYPFSLLQLLTILLVMILILVIFIISLLWLQLMAIFLVVILIFAIFILSFLVVATSDPPNHGRDLDLGGLHLFFLS